MRGLAPPLCVTSPSTLKTGRSAEYNLVALGGEVVQDRDDSLTVGHHVFGAEHLDQASVSDTGEAERVPRLVCQRGICGARGAVESEPRSMRAASSRTPMRPSLGPVGSLTVRAK